nr:MAG TPA: AAA domain protein [Bacteriophage sp.]
MIRKPAEMVNTENRFRVLIAGYPGIGKTTLGLSAPKPLLIDVDFGINRTMASVRKDYIQPESYDELLNDLKGDLSDYETIVIDTGGKLLDLMKAYVIKNDIKNAKKDGTLSLQGYGAVGREFSRFMNYIYFDLRKHCVIIFHAVEEKQDEDTKLRILVEGSTKNTVWQNVELGGFIEMRGNKKTIGFDNCERYFAKSSFGIKGNYTIPELDGTQLNDFLTKLFEQANKNIQEESKVFEEERKQYQEVMNALNPLIENMTLENVNEVIEAIKTVPHILTSEKEAKAHFAEKIKELNLVWNKEKQQYEVKQEVQNDVQKS